MDKSYDYYCFTEDYKKSVYFDYNIITLIQSDFSNSNDYDITEETSEYLFPLEKEKKKSLYISFKKNNGTEITFTFRILDDDLCFDDVMIISFGDF
jgi:hypothetical protein